MASLQENIFCLYSEDPEKAEGVISALAEIAEFAENRTISEVLSILREASEQCSHVFPDYNTTDTLRKAWQWALL